MGVSTACAIFAHKDSLTNNHRRMNPRPDELNLCGHVLCAGVRILSSLRNCSVLPDLRMQNTGGQAQLVCDDQLRQSVICVASDLGPQTCRTAKNPVHRVQMHDRVSQDLAVRPGGQCLPAHACLRATSPLLQVFKRPAEVRLAQAIIEGSKEVGPPTSSTMLRTSPTRKVEPSPPSKMECARGQVIMDLPSSSSLASAASMAVRKICSVRCDQKNASRTCFHALTGFHRPRRSMHHGMVHVSSVHKHPILDMRMMCTWHLSRSSVHAAARM